MRAISLWQPWASLVVLGEKRIETRGRRAPSTIIGQTIAIHAARERSELALIGTSPFREALGRHGIGAANLPLGALVGTVRVDGCVEMTDQWIHEVDDRELRFGHYAPGRFGYLLSQPRALDRPRYCRGHQSVFFVPDEALR